MKFVRRDAKKKADNDKEIPKKPKLYTHPKEVKQRAFELFMEIKPGKPMARRYGPTEIVRIIQKEMKTQFDVSRLTERNVAHWISNYGWVRYYTDAVAKAKKLASDVLTCTEAYEYATSGIRANTLVEDKINRAVEKQAVVAKQVDKMSLVAASMIVDLFMVTVAHREKLNDVIPGAGGAWRYDCGTSGRRKQLFDMWMEGVTKLMDIYNLTPPKKTTTRATISSGGGDQEIAVDSTTGSGVDLGPLSQLNFETILKVFGVQQLKGGFGNELRGPDNADFPSTAGTEGADGEGKAGADS